MIAMPNMLEKQDLELIHDLQEGNKEALSELFLRYHGTLLHYGLRIRPDQSLVDESVQELFVYLFEQGSGLGHVQSVKAYLYKSLRRRILEKIERLDKERRVIISSIHRSDIVFLPEDSDRDHGETARLALLEALNTLPWRQREAVYLRYYNRLKTKEIAEIMGAANQTVLNTLYQALKNLRKHDNLRNLMGSILP